MPELKPIPTFKQVFNKVKKIKKIEDKEQSKSKLIYSYIFCLFQILKKHSNSYYIWYF